MSHWHGHDSFLERIARAIALADDEDYAEDARCYDKRARAAIEAFGQPTMAMLHAAVDATDAGSGMSWRNRTPQMLFEAGFKAMIRAANEADQ